MASAAAASQSRLSLAASTLTSTSPRIPETLKRDVVVFGGGASGMYAAMKLRDLGYSVVVIEKANRLGEVGSKWIKTGTRRAMTL
ncbi:MAG: NAD(P)-binding protein [Chitinophagaceae bacterium]|nr:NAD(P)-binding protein [Oligoflexus sp.]